jgi:outer membrane protein assembly factor BamB
MNHPLGFRPFALLFVFCFVATPAHPQSAKVRWTKDFPKPISWYVHTSAGILLVKTGKPLTALDPDDGHQLWQLPDAGQDIPLRNLVELPGMGVLLLNHTKVPGQSDDRLVALNLLTGERLWDGPQIDDLLTAVPLPGSREFVLVSIRLQRKVLAAEAAASGAAHLPLALYPYPFRFEFRRLDPLTGKTQWSAEYPHTLNIGSFNLAAFGDHLLLYFANSILGCVDLANGSRLWEVGSKKLMSASPSLPLEFADTRLIYVLKDVRATDPATNQLAWKIDRLGKVTGLSLHDGLLAALGDEHIAAVDVKTGAERWRAKTHGHTTNLLWNEQTSSLIYADAKGLHSIEFATGKALLDAPLRDIYHPSSALLASPDAVVLIATDQVAAYNSKTGTKLFSAGKLYGFSRASMYQAHFPIPEKERQVLIPVVENTSDEVIPDYLSHDTLLPDSVFSRWESYVHLTQGQLDAYETQPQPAVTMTWWLDPQADRQIQFQISGDLHEINRPAGIAFAVVGNQLMAATLNAH